MFKCVNCDYQGDEFHAEVANIDQGTYTYRAVCPKCGSHLVNVLAGYKEGQLRIGVPPAKPVKEQRITYGTTDNPF